MKNKKGFTLVEIIVCIALLAVIGTVIGVSIYNNSNENKEEEKIINEVITAADVYYSSNIELQEKIKDNFGYYLVSVEELKKSGYIDNNLKILEDKDNKSYGSVLFVNEDIGNTYNTEANEEVDNLGLVDVEYPYSKTSPFGIIVDSIQLTEDEAKRSFKCNTKSKDETINEIYYLNKNYEKESYEEFECSIEGNDEYFGKEEKPFENENINIDTEVEYINYTLNYLPSDNINNRNATTRNVFIYSNPNLELKAESNARAYIRGEWTNKDVLLYWENKSAYSNIQYKWKNNGVEDAENISNSYTLKAKENMVETIEVTGQYTYGLLSISNPVEESYEIKIDTKKPIIDVRSVNNNKKLKLNITDEGSGVYGYYFSDEDIEDSSNKDNYQPYTNSVEFSVEYNKTYYIYAIDKAGNVSDYVYSLTNYPVITTEPIDGTISKFRVTLTNFNGDIDTAKVQYTFANRGDHDFYDINDMPGRSSSKETWFEVFNNNFSYNENYDTNQKNTKGYTSELSCTKNNDVQTCTFEVDMNDVINNCTASKTGGYCRKVVAPDYLDNLSINYYIYAKNSNNYSAEYKVNSKLRVFKKRLTGWDDTDFFNYRKSAVNDDGNVIYVMQETQDKDLYQFYYYINETGKIINLNSGYKIYEKNSGGGCKVDFEYSIYEWTDTNIKFVQCNTQNQNDVSDDCSPYKKTFEYYDYNILKNSTTYTKKTQTKNSYSCTVEDSILVNSSKFSKFNSKYKHYDFLYNFITIYKDWAKQVHDTREYYNFTNKLDNLLMYTNVNGENKYSLLIYLKDDDKNDLYYMLHFYEKLELTPIS